MKTARWMTLALCAGVVCAPAARAFCGFYVAKADTKLFNEASKVVIAREQALTALLVADAPALSRRCPRAPTLALAPRSVIAHE